MKRIGTWIVAAATLAAGCGTRVDRQLFAGLDRVSQAILAEVPRVSLDRYRELTNSYASELTAAHARAQTPSVGSRTTGSKAISWSPGPT